MALFATRITWGCYTQIKLVVSHVHCETRFRHRNEINRGKDEYDQQDTKFKNSQNITVQQKIKIPE